MFCLIAFIIILLAIAGCIVFRKSISTFIRRHKRKIIAGVVIASLATTSLILLPVGDPSGIDLSDWSYYKQITIESDHVDTTLTNFPILFDNVSSDFLHAQDDGDDFIFVSADNSTQYNHEIESYNASGNNQLLAWINITTLVHDVDTVLWLYYGNAGASNQQDIENTWDSGFRCVQHLNESYSKDANHFKDSTSNNQDGTLVDADTDSATIAGMVGNGFDFDGDADNIDIGVMNHDYPITFSCWFNSDNYDSNDEALGRYYGSDKIGTFATGLGRVGYSLAVDGTFHADNDYGSDGNDIWYLIHVVYDGTGVYSYYQGVNETGDAKADTGSIDEMVRNWEIGSDGNTDFWDGQVDEVRFSNAKRSDGWILTSYNTMSNPSTFLTVGSEQLGTTIYTTNIRNDGVDYFVWLGGNISASDVDDEIENFDESAEYISIWRNGTWGGSAEGNWVTWTGVGGGTDFNIKTFDVVKVYLTDSSTQEISMTANADIAYGAEKSVTLLNDSITKGGNYTGYTTSSSTNLSNLATTISLDAGESVWLWNETTFIWNYFIVDFYEPDIAVHEDDVIFTKVEDTETWAISGK